MTTGKNRDFVTIAAAGHGAPAPAPGPRGIIEKEPARRVGTGSKTGACAFGDDFGGRTRNGCQEPVQAAFAGDKFQAPFAILLEEFVVALGDAQDFVDRRDPVAEQGFFGEHGAEDFAQGGMQGLSLCEEGGGALRVILGEREQLGASF